MGRKAGLILMALVLLGMAGFVSAHSITVDGDPSDWTGDASTLSDNSYTVSNGEWIWKDATGDVGNRLSNGESITVDGNLGDWRSDTVVGTGKDNGEAGAKLDKLYVAWDDNYLYIAIKTNNTASWNVAYGFGIDVDPGSGKGYTGGDSPSDAWNRKIGFKSPFAIDYEVYFYWSGSSNSITSAQLFKWTGSEWTKTADLTGGTDYASTGGSNGLQTLEIKIPWSSLGSPNSPEDVAVIAWITGNSGSAVSSAPWDSTLEDSSDEWSDTDYFSNLVKSGRVDITEFRVTADDNYFYFLIEFKDLDLVGKDGAPGIMITIDTDQTTGSGETWFGYDSNTQVAQNGNADWEYQLLIDLANSQVTNGGVVHGDGKPVWNGGSPLDLVDTSWNDISSSNDEFAASTSNNAVEVRILKSELGNPSKIRVELAVVRATSSGGSEGGSGSHVVDAMTTTGPSTWDEVSDGYVDYYADIDVSQVPFFSSLAVALAVLLGALIVFRRR